MVSAAGVAGLVRKEWIKPGAVVIDVGINFVRKKDVEGRTMMKMCGDVHDDVWQVASQVSPVPGGVGLMTVAMLLRNCCDAALQARAWDSVCTQARGVVAATTAVQQRLKAKEGGTDASSPLPEEVQQAFAWMDLDGDGEITARELRAALQRGDEEGAAELNDSEAEARILDMISRADTDGNMTVSMEELAAVVKSGGGG